MWNKYINEVNRFDRVVIYGAGKIGRRVLDTLEKVNMQSKVLCFAVSDGKSAPDIVNNIPVKAIDEISEEYEDALFLLSVGDRLMYELEQMMVCKKVNHYFDGKNLYRINDQGDKEEKHIEIDVREVFMLQHRRGSFNRLDIIVRYLAIEAYHGINDYGFDLYRKMQAQRISEDYVEGAVERFKKLIASWEQIGYDHKSEIECDSKLHLIDGSHRIAMCLYYGVNKISCKVDSYADDIKYGEEWFIEHDFNVEEIGLIKDKFNELYKVICGI